MSDPLLERAPQRKDIALLRQRAAALARVPRRQREQTLTPMVIFELGGERYGIAASVVLQVAVLRDLTPLPGAAAPLFGVTHWRGDVLTIFDLREALGVRPSGVTDLSRIIVVDGGGAPIGVLADAARDFQDIDEGTIRPLSAQDAGRRSLLRGITDDAVLVIDTGAFLRRYGTGRPTDGSGG